MNIDNLPFYTLSSPVVKDISWLIKAILPSLIDVKVYNNNGEIADIDYFFGGDDDPCGIEEFTGDTRSKLITIAEVFAAVMNLRFK